MGSVKAAVVAELELVMPETVALPEAAAEEEE